MRELDPFSFFINHASAIDGLGGGNMSPDPRYCFHTVYEEVRPGQAHYELRLSGVRASRGELALRVHAFRPHTGENASLVAGARLDVAVDAKQDLSVSVRFAALRNVHYAFYGYFIEDSDIHADSLTVLLHEPEGEEADYVEPPRSVLALEPAEYEVRPANALIHVVTPRLSAPVSQDCTRAQIAEVTAQHGPDASLEDWAETLCLNALRTYDIIAPALEGLIVGPCSARLSQSLAASGFSMTQMDSAPLPASNSSLFADFLVCPAAAPSDTDPARRWESAKAWLGRLKIGGLGVMLLRYNPQSGPSRGGLAVDGDRITRNEIGKWALRLIADGYSVAPLAFSAPEDLFLDDEGLASFVLIVRRQ